MSLLTESENPKTGNELIGADGNDHEVVIRLENVSVVYSAPRERIKTFKEYAIRVMKRQVEHQQFNALGDVSLELRRGEVFGLVGHNGAGKSTMLKIVSRVMKPTRGRVWVKGKVAPLLELGAGFHPELSGRENVFLNGTLLGFSRAEMAEMFDGIVEFSEIGEFIDAPLRTYSTGMIGRLGFAVATATRPDILIVDEVLSVGDEQFQEKCSARIAEFRRLGTTILLVTHSSKLVQRICDRAGWLDHGKLCGVGQPDEIIEQYHARYHTPAVKLADDDPAPNTAVVNEQTLTLEQLALSREWFYPFELPSGAITACSLPPEIASIHADRWAMVKSVLTETFGKDWSPLDCLDIGCNQGFFPVKLAERGCRKVVGLDARQQNVDDAELIRQIYGLDNLSFQTGDISKIEPAEWPQFDVTLMLSLLFWLENPIGALRAAKAMTKRVLLVETPVVPEIKGKIDWGAHRSQKAWNGTFALFDLSREVTLPIGSLTNLSLCPGQETLIWVLEHLGFSRVEIVPPPHGAYEQLATGKRIMVAAYV